MCTLVDLIDSIDGELAIPISKENRSVDATDTDAIISIMPSRPIREEQPKALLNLMTCPVTGVVFERISRSFRALNTAMQVVKCKVVRYLI